MKIIVAVCAIALTLAPSQVRAQERAGSAAIGAVSGAVVLGPVGAVAGAVIGYAAGPEIARSWRASRSNPPRHRVARRARLAQKQRPSDSAPGEVTPAPPAPGVGGPPAQGFE
ncbi:MAG: DNA-directed RNA polymerase subunit N [Alphaproteobacteria bacterium]|nr:MAG: DNA-directed RNA polymerase subunit N [Alphaproteobacteria bacterium]